MAKRGEYERGGKSRQTTILMTVVERALVSRAADLTGTSQSQFIRIAALNAARKTLRELDISPDGMVTSHVPILQANLPDHLRAMAPGQIAFLPTSQTAPNDDSAPSLSSPDDDDEPAELDDDEPMRSGAPHGDDCGCAACRNFDD